MRERERDIPGDRGRDKEMSQVARESSAKRRGMAWRAMGEEQHKWLSWSPDEPRGGAWWWLESSEGRWVERGDGVDDDGTTRVIAYGGEWACRRRKMGDGSLIRDVRRAAWVEGGGRHGARVEVGCH